jgi:hypothetical protein
MKGKEKTLDVRTVPKDSGINKLQKFLKSFVSGRAVFDNSLISVDLDERYDIQIGDDLRQIGSRTFSLSTYFKKPLYEDGEFVAELKKVLGSGRVNVVGLDFGPFGHTKVNMNEDIEKVLEYIGTDNSPRGPYPGFDNSFDKVSLEKGIYKFHGDVYGLRLSRGNTEVGYVVMMPIIDNSIEPAKSPPELSH